MRIKGKFSKFIIIAILLIPSISFEKTANEWFTTGQDADLLLSGIDFNNTGGPLLFNHPGNVATDGTRLLLADRNNNRVLIWNTIPAGNVEPDLVLGQENFVTNNPGTGLNNLNWPVGISTANEKVVVADTYNDKILIWNTFPITNGQSADLCINLKELNDPINPGIMEWPWAVWTNGTKLVATATGGARVLIWNTFPTTNNQNPDLILRGKNANDDTTRFGTPRSIGTDGETFLVIGDHNAEESSTQGNFFWNSFPTSDQPYDFFMQNPFGPELMWGGVKSPDGKFIIVSSPGISIWNSVPTVAVDPDLIVGKTGGFPPDVICDENGYGFNDGDGSGLALTPSGKLFISLYNGSNIVVFNSIPTSATQCPDYAIGAPDIDTNTLVTNYIITNPIPATNGAHLFVSSGFDRKLYVWKSIPTASGTHPDYVYKLEPFQPVDNALYGNTFVQAGERKVQIWTTLPLYENSADITFDGQIGSANFQEIKGVALDDKYLYVADYSAGKLYVWNSLPDSDTDPLFSLDMPGAWRLSTNGNYLTVTKTYDHKIQIYSVATLSGSSSPIAEIPALDAPYGLNLPENALVAEGHLFVADNGNSRVFGWESIDDAINGNDPDVILGKEDYNNTKPAIGIDSLFWPAGLALHRNRLWVGEFKFSHRIVRFNFELATCSLTIATGTGGTTDPLPGTYPYDPGAEVTITAIPESGYEFSGWSGDASGTDNPTTITMDSDKSVTANFIRQYTLTIASGTGGTTDPSPGTYTYDDGTEVTITAIPDSGYTFSSWSGDASGSNNPITITVNSDKSVTANFKTTGGDDESGKKGGCFIATAAYGSPLHPHVRILRDFRDIYLMPSRFGRVMVDLYYKYSPFGANLIAKHKALKDVFQISLLPFVAFSYLTLYLGPTITALPLVFVFLLTVFFVWFYPRRMRD